MTSLEYEAANYNGPSASKGLYLSFYNPMDDADRIFQIELEIMFKDEEEEN